MKIRHAIPVYSGKLLTRNEIDQVSKVALVGYAHRDLTYKLNGEDFIGTGRRTKKRTLKGEEIFD